MLTIVIICPPVPAPQIGVAASWECRDYILNRELGGSDQMTGASLLLITPMD